MGLMMLIVVVIYGTSFSEFAFEVREVDFFSEKMMKLPPGSLNLTETTVSPISDDADFSDTVSMGAGTGGATS